MFKSFLFTIVFLCAVNMQAAMKSIAACYIDDAKIILDGKIDEPCWNKAEIFDDFLLYKSKELSQEKAEARVFTDGENLYVAVKSFEKTADICASDNPDNLWAGDVIELFFGSLKLDNDYRYQVAATPNGLRFASDWRLNEWQSASFIGENFWSVEFKIPLNKLKFTNHSTKFNIGCYKKTLNKQLTWVNLGNRFKGIERFGELILGSYNSALEAKVSLFVKEKVSRSEYEQLYHKYAKPAWGIEFPPYLHDATDNRITISWKTYSQVPGRVLYRKKGAANFMVVSSNLKHGANAGNYTRHHADLINLESGKEYEYQVQTFDTSSDTWNSFNDNWQCFSLPSKEKKDFSFVAFTDFHSFGDKLKNFMQLKQTQNADFVVNLGDMIDYADFQADYYTCVVAPQSDFAKNKPVYHIRGNHETYGYAPLGFFEVFPHHSGKSYYTFNCGNVLFIALDCGDDRPFPGMIKLANEQNLWLKELVKSEDFKNAEACVLLCHMPIISAKSRYSKRLNIILKDVFIGENPLAKADLMLAGHTHIASITPANSDSAKLFGSDKESTEAIKTPFPIICNDGPFLTQIDFSMLWVQKCKNSLIVNIVLENGSSLASHEIKLQEKK